jgi:cytochrome b
MNRNDILRTILYSIVFVILIVAICLISSCNDKPDDVVKQPSHDGAIETKLSTIHGDKYDLLTITSTIWVAGKVDKVITRTDTLKNLGFMMTDGQDAEGNTEHEDGTPIQVKVPRDYEFYITVK